MKNKETKLKITEIESYYKHHHSKKKLLIFDLIKNYLVGIRIMDGDKIEGSIVIDMDKLRKALKWRK